VGTVKLFLERGISIESLTDHGWSPLHLAAENGHLSVVEYLINMKASFDVLDNDGKRPLDLARKNGHSGIELFLEEVEKNLKPVCCVKL
jgi:ankyrin repeat protein